MKNFLVDKKVWNLLPIRSAQNILKSFTSASNWGFHNATISKDLACLKTRNFAECSFPNTIIVDFYAWKTRVPLANTYYKSYQNVLKLPPIEFGIALRQ